MVSKRKGGISPFAGETVVDVDRTNPILGNRHVLADHRDDRQRETVIEAYRRDFEDDMARAGPMFRAVEGLARRFVAGESIALRCWCAPRPCHAEIIQRMVLKLAGVSPDVVAERVGPDAGQACLF